jgi:hypothetical protein
MKLDWKHLLVGLAGLVGGPLLALGLGWLHMQGVDLPCPSAPPAVSAPAN